MQVKVPWWVAKNKSPKIIKIGLSPKGPKVRMLMYLGLGFRGFGFRIIVL